VVVEGREDGERGFEGTGGVNYAGAPCNAREAERGRPELVGAADSGQVTRACVPEEPWPHQVRAGAEWMPVCSKPPIRSHLRFMPAICPSCVSAQ
jgi:hypothetical protein